MERRFDMSDFEQSLKDHADQFSLIPSKRVWNGIYNNLHPGSRWPSVTVALIFLITLVTVGNLNNSKKTLGNEEITAANSPGKQTNSGNSILQKNETTAKNTQNRIASESKISTIQDREADKDISRVNSANKNSAANENLSKKNNSLHKNNSGKSLNQIQTVSGLNEIPATSDASKKSILVKQEENKLVVLKNNAENSLSENQKEFFTALAKLEILPPNQNAFTYQPISSDKNALISPDRTSITHTSALPSNTQIDDPSSIITLVKTLSVNNSTTKKTLRKKNKNVEWTFYVTPLISGVSFEKKTFHPVASTSSSMVLLPNQPSSFQLIHNPALGVETGAEISFKISKKFKVITGANVNYSSYRNVSNFVHPTFGTLILTDKSGTYIKSYLTHYGNGQSPSQISLNNYNLEASVPIGLKYNIWNNGKMQIDLSSLIAPSAVFKSNAFIISSDGRYYINEPSLVRKFNMAVAFGSYITFKAKNIKWHIGPDFRYQLLSTYKNIYPNKEHFMDYGIRIGISK